MKELKCDHSICKSKFSDDSNVLYYGDDNGFFYCLDISKVLSKSLNI